MFFGDAGIKGTFRKFSGKIFQSGSIEHGGGNGNDPGISLAEFDHGVSECFGKSGRRFRKRSLFRIASGNAVVACRISFSETASGTFGGHYVKHHRTAGVPELSKNRNQFFQIMAIHRADITQTESFKKVSFLRHQKFFDAVDHAAHQVEQFRTAFQTALEAVTDTVV